MDLKIDYIPSEVKSYTTEEEFTASFYENLTYVRVRIWAGYFQTQYWRSMTHQWEPYYQPIPLETLNAALEAYNKVKQGK